MYPAIYLRDNEQNGRVSVSSELIPSDAMHSLLQLIEDGLEDLACYKYPLWGA